MIMDSKLTISKNLKSVMYDGHSYKIRDVIYLQPKDLEIKHVCSDNVCFTYDWGFIFEHKKKRYYATFCNRCKTLFMRAVR